MNAPRTAVEGCAVTKMGAAGAEHEGGYVVIEGNRIVSPSPPGTKIGRTSSGCTIFASRAGRLVGNHFLTVTEGRENLRALGEKILRDGVQDILFERAP